VKFVRFTLSTLAVVALISGCGKSSAPTRVTSTEETPTLDTAAPPAPQSLGVTTDPTTGLSRMNWEPSSAADVAGYDVFVYNPDPARDNAYVLLNTISDGSTSFDLDPTASNTVKFFRVRAVDRSGNHSPLSSMLEAHLRPASPAGTGSGDGDPENPGLPTMNP